MNIFHVRSFCIHFLAFLLTNWILTRVFIRIMIY